MATGAPQTAKKTHKGRKVNRNKAWCEGYRRAMKHEKSHIRRIAKHLLTHENDGPAKHRPAELKRAVGIFS